MTPRPGSSRSRSVLRRMAAPLLLLLTVMLGAVAQNPASMRRLTRPQRMSAAAEHADTTPIAPTVPSVDRHTPGRVFLERADSLIADPMARDVQILVGNVVFRRGDMMMYCDSACFYSTDAGTDSMEAFGNVHMEQGDTLFLYGDMLEYSGSQELAVVYADPGRTVRLINRDVTLTTTVINYYLGIDLGYYNVGGTLTDPRNRLVSDEGEYSPPTKDANFYGDVVMDGLSESGDSVWVYTDTLSYNTDTHLAALTCPSRVVSKDGIIFTSNGLLDTNTNYATLFDRSVVRTHQGNTLTGDTLVYDSTLGYGEAFGSMVMTDSARQVSLSGNYGFYNEVTDSAYVTGRAMAMEYSGVDTLYLHGREIRSFMLPDSTHLMVANPRVRFFRRDLQGICDSMTYVELDSTLRMNVHPVVWSDNRQIFGNEMRLFMNDSTVERAWLPDFGFMAEHVDEDFYNQLSGKEMWAYMADGHLRRLDVNGSVQAIMLPQESDSTYNKIANIESSYLSALFTANEIERAHLWNESSGTVTPLYLAKRSLFRLPKFKWYELLRPVSPDDIFRIPPEMEQLLSEPSI